MEFMFIIKVVVRNMHTSICVIGHILNLWNGRMIWGSQAQILCAIELFANQEKKKLEIYWKRSPRIKYLARNVIKEEKTLNIQTRHIIPLAYASSGFINKKGSPTPTILEMMYAIKFQCVQQVRNAYEQSVVLNHRVCETHLLLFL